MNLFNFVAFDDFTDPRKDTFVHATLENITIQKLVQALTNITMQSLTGRRTALQRQGCSAVPWQHKIEFHTDAE